MQIIDGNGLGGVVGGRVYPSVPGYGLLNGVVVPAVALMQFPMPVSRTGIAQAGMDQGEVEVCLGILGVYLQNPLEPGLRPLQQCHTYRLSGRPPLLPGTVVKHSSQLVQHPDVFGKIETSATCLAISGIGEILQRGNGPIEISVFPVNQG
jgi:hypothetical protein